MCKGRNKAPRIKTSPFKNIQNERGKSFFPSIYSSQC